MGIYKRGFQGILWEVQLGITLSLSIIYEEEHGFQIKLHRCGLLIWQDAARIDTFRNTKPQGNCQSAIRVDPTNVKGPCSFALKRFIIFKNFLTNLVVKVDKLFVGTKQWIIDQLFSVCENGIPICKKRNVEEHVSRERKSSRCGLQLQHSWNRWLQGMHGSDQGIIHK